MIVSTSLREMEHIYLKRNIINQTCRGKGKKCIVVLVENKKALALKTSSAIRTRIRKLGLKTQQQEIANDTRNGGSDGPNSLP